MRYFLEKEKENRCTMIMVSEDTIQRACMHGISAIDTSTGTTSTSIPNLPELPPLVPLPQLNFNGCLAHSVLHDLVRAYDLQGQIDWCIHYYMC